MAMKRTKFNDEKLSTQIKKHSKKEPKQSPEFDGNTNKVVSTGSTLLDLAISGGRFYGGGIPTGIIVEIFGPPGCGKTIIMCEMAGIVQNNGGQVMFRDPEARLNKQFSKMLGMKPNEIEYDTPDTVPQLFKDIREWQPEPEDKIHAVFADSLAALSTDMEMDNEEGDKRGQRRAKEFSEHLRKTCRVIKKKNYIIMCSNQIRESDSPYGKKYKSTGGHALPHYTSLRLRAANPKKIYGKIKWKGKEVKRPIGVITEIEVFKSSVWKPFRTAEVPVIFDYGIDDIRANLQFLKSNTKDTTYKIKDESFKSIDDAISYVEENSFETLIKKNVIELWNEIESKFKQGRKPKKR